MQNPFRYFGVFVGFLCSTLMSFASSAEEVEITTTEQIEDIVRNYLLEHPEVIAEAVAILQARAEAAAHEANRAALHKNRDLLENDPLSIVAGNPNGDVTLVELYDYRCPYCRQSHESIMRLIEEDENLKIVFKQFPVKDRPGETPVSLISARIAMAAEKQGLFLPFHDAMFTAEPPLSERKVYEIAKEVGIDVDRALQDMKDPVITQHLRETLILASEIGATGTPTFVVGDYLIPGMVDYDVLKQLIDITRETNMANAQPQDARVVNFPR